MTKEQELFLKQAKSAYSVYRLLNEDKSLHHCHALHYLQMATELLGKAHAWRRGPVEKSHKAIVGFLRSLSSNSKAQKRLGYEGQNENWAHTIRKVLPMAEALQQMAPRLAGDGPNPEYPWPPRAPATAPVEYDFPIWKELTETAYGRVLLALVRNLFDSADEYM
jgi:hypothetical protein